MKVLAVNTASQRLSIALADGEKILFSTEVDEPRDQGNFLLQASAQCLKDNGLAFSGLDLIAAVTGPGSFTGIRIGLAAMQGFALAANVKLAGMTSFDLYAAVVKPATTHRLMVIESWRDELYFQLDDGEPFNVTAQDCLRRMPSRDVTLAGDAVEKMAALLPEAVIDQTRPTAADVARLMVLHPDLRGAAVPFYLRPADATIAAGGRHLQQG